VSTFSIFLSSSSSSFPSLPLWKHFPSQSKWINYMK
jgi:hypothetical protein